MAVHMLGWIRDESGYSSIQSQSFSQPFAKAEGLFFGDEEACEAWGRFGALNHAYIDGYAHSRHVHDSIHQLD